VAAGTCPESTPRIFSNVCKPCPSAGQQKPRTNILRGECKTRVCTAAMMPDAKKTPRSSGNFGVKQHAEQSPFWCRPVFTFFHPDYTVGLEVSSSRAGALAPACGLYRRSGIATPLFCRSPCPEGVIQLCCNCTALLWSAVRSIGGGTERELAVFSLAADTSAAAGTMAAASTAGGAGWLRFIGGY